MSIQNLEIDFDQISQICEMFQVRKLSLFGSVLREDFTLESDIDVLVEFLPSAPITYLDMVDIQDKLSVILGRNVDLLTPNFLSPYFRDDVLTIAQVVYECP